MSDPEDPGPALSVGDLTAPRSTRNFPRLTLRGEADLVAIDQGRPQPQLVAVQLQDLAWGGFGFLSPIPLEVGSRWRALFLAGRHEVGAQTLVVRHCTQLKEGLYRTGAQVCIEHGLVRVLGVDWATLSAERARGRARLPAADPESGSEE